MKPAELMDFIFSNFVVPWRANDLISRNPNFKPVSIEATGQLAVFGQLYEELANTLDLMQRISGLNELTDGSTPNAKTLVPVAQAAMESTNNAIYLVAEGYKNILRRTADAVVQKIQIAVKLGKVAGYAKALGNNTVQFFNINPDIALHELGIFIDDAPSDAQREALWQDVNLKESQGLLTVGDKAFVMTCRNIQEAYQVLDYKIKKRREELQAFELQKINEANEGNMMAQEAAEATKVQSATLLHQLELEKISAEKQWDYVIEAMKKQSDQQEAMIQSEGKIEANTVVANAKIIAQQIAAVAQETSGRISAASHIIGKKIDLKKKPKPATK
jgi:hypothetical protein